MIIDPHTHSNEISLCSRISLNDIVDVKKQAGYGGIVITNHCQPWYYVQNEHAEFMKKFVNVYKEGKKYADTVGFKVMLGIEVSINDPLYTDWLIYGLSEKDLLSSPCLYMLNQKELFEFCESCGAILVQAHPFRGEMRPLDPEYMRGVEVNCQPNDLKRKDDVIAFAKQNGLLLTSGVDYHGREMTMFCGMEVPDDTETSADFAKCLKEGKAKLFIDGKVLEI